MNDKIALVSCSGLSPLGLIVRAASVDLALENDNIVVACITASSAETDKCVAITGCEDDGVSKILIDKGIKIDKTIAAEKFLDKNEFDSTGIARLDSNGERAVKKLKEYILKELEKL